MAEYLGHTFDLVRQSFDRPAVTACCDLAAQPDGAIHPGRDIHVTA